MHNQFYKFISRSRKMFNSPRFFIKKNGWKIKNIKIIKVLSHTVIGVTYYVSIKDSEWIERKRNEDKLIFSGRMLVHNNDGKQKFQCYHNYLCK